MLGEEDLGVNDQREPPVLPSEHQTHNPVLSPIPGHLQLPLRSSLSYTHTPCNAWSHDRVTKVKVSFSYLAVTSVRSSCPEVADSGENWAIRVRVFLPRRNESFQSMV